MDLREPREGFGQRRRGRSFHVEGPKTEKVREPTRESQVRGIWRLRVSEAERRIREHHTEASAFKNVGLVDGLVVCLLQ